MNRKKMPSSFVMFGRLGKYRVWCNPASGFWYSMRGYGKDRTRLSLGVRTRPEAEAKVREIDDPPQPFSRPLQRQMTWQEYADMYLLFKEESGLAKGSVKRYRAAMDAFGRYLKKKGISYVSEVSLIILEGYSAFRCKEEQCDVKTAYNDSLVLKNALKWGSRASRGLLAANPAVDWETKEPIKPKRPCYSTDDVEKLEVEARAWLRPIITVLAWTGLRVDELINLRWQDVDLEQRMIHVRIRGDWRPKGKRDRKLPIFPQVEAVLRQRSIGQYVFTGPNGGRLKETYVLECLKADQVRLGLPENDLHGFRRFFATHMMTKGGVDADTVRQWGGWKFLETMLRYLADVNVKDSVAAMETAVRRMAAAS